MSIHNINRELNHVSYL